MKLVKVARVGGKLKEVCLNDRDTISQAIAAAGLAIRQNEDAWINHHIVDINAQVGNKEIIILEPRVISPAIRSFIDKLVEHEIIEPEDYEDEDGELEYDEVYAEERDMKEDLMKGA